MTGNWHLNATDMVKRMTLLDNLVDLQTRISGRDIERETKKKTTPLVPLRRGWLERSFRSFIRSEKPFKMDIQYSAKSNKGYDYSAYQHELELSHPKRGTDHYLLKGFENSRPVNIWATNLLRVL